ncbi:glycosyltransferase [Glutamicibacter sp. MNS18]|uniref:glycosyltransferase n=1 Tax=Glutamicibacter sp. MNS18 TaxID=2989817 RepID=UPI0022361333|nr:glycosyltransferase [Glutamicibacter sp. MNS18]MCW4466137.1 glycosyltransferase [Glutamicibacter sp. MNS18]
MDVKKLKNRLATIAGRVSQLSSPAGFPREFDMETHLGSRYYLDALQNKHPFLEPARHHKQYLERRGYFADRRTDIGEEYAAIINQSQTVSQRWYTPFNLRIGIIADEFLFKSFASTAHFIPLTPTNFRQQAAGLDLVLVTSTWRGLAGEWVGAAQANGVSRKLIEQELIPYFRDQAVPVAFYSKEDPPNYQAFLGLAKLCDFVFTSATEMIEKYRQDCPQALRIEVLPFSIDFRHHNPVGTRRHRINDILFAGSWHNHKYEERRRSAAAIFDGVIASERRLRIIDRNWELGKERYLFPERYMPYVEPSVDHAQLLRIHRTSDIAINLNSVVASSTMYANRVVELQAMGSTVLSNYNAGVNDQFPNVYMPESSFDARDIIQSLDAEHLYTNQMAGLRNVYTGHVNFDRMRTLFSVCGLADATRQDHRIGIVGDHAATARFIDCQHYAGALQPFETPAQAEAAGMELLCTVNDGFDYGQHYLQDLVNATKFVGARRIQKSASGPMSGHHDFTDATEPECGSLQWITGNEENPGMDSGQEVYAVDHLGLQPRHRASARLEETSRYALSVVVPIYNNGRHLEFKCFESLRRSSIFEKMEILLIDDGSTDQHTVATVRRLAERYPNVRTFFHDSGGSGSASRPRNLGLVMATSEWVTYLDPDNEALSDGYAKLLASASRNGADFAIGNMVRNSHRRQLFNYVRKLRKFVHQDEVGTDTYRISRELLPKIDYTPMSIQALVANTQWLRSLGIEQPLGAVGQDSYFFQQMLFYARKISLLNEPIHAYFAAVSNSTVNTLGTSFYRKYIPLERSRAQWLEDVGLLQDYKERRLEGFIKGWYLEKLQRVAAEELESSKEVIAELAGYYGHRDWQDASLREFFKDTETVR